MPDYPIAETFVSPQGEGTHVGVLQHFIRFAGCTVGKPYSKEEHQASERGNLPVLMPYQERCTAWDGTSFPCDTNFRMARKMSIDDILAEVKTSKRVLLTGGEPLMHDLLPLISSLVQAGKLVFIETSGTIDLADFYKFAAQTLWLTVSPKAGYLETSLQYASELKVLVDQSFDPVLFQEKFGRYLYKTFIQPVNNENSLRQDNIRKCLQIQEQFPEVRLSLQMHKVIGCR